LKAGVKQYVRLEAFTSWLFDPTNYSTICSEPNLKGLSLSYYNNTTYRLQSVLNTINILSYHVSSLKGHINNSISNLRHTTDNRFIRELITSFDRRYTSVIDMEWVYKRLALILKRIEEYLGIEMAVLVDDRINKLSFSPHPSTLINHRNLSEYSIPKSDTIGTFLKERRTIIFDDRLMEDRRYIVRPDSLLNEFNAAISEIDESFATFAVLPIPITFLNTVPLHALLVLYIKEGSTNWSGRPIIYQRVRDQLTSMLRFMEVEIMRTSYIARIDHDLLHPISLIRSVPHRLEYSLDEYGYNSAKTRGELQSAINALYGYADAFQFLQRTLFFDNDIQITRDMYEHIHLDTSICKPIFALLKAKSDRKSLNLKSKLRNTGTVYVAKEHLFLVFYNVLANAVKYSFKGNHILVDFVHTKGLLQINISSASIDIPEDEKDTIYLDGVRGSAANSMDAHGMGIGLHRCKILMKQMGGDIWHTKSAKSGLTIFHLLFTYKEGEAPHD
jgi:signal transduction histidine kinase